MVNNINKNMNKNMNKSMNKKKYTRKGKNNKWITGKDTKTNIKTKKVTKANSIPLTLVKLPSLYNSNGDITIKKCILNRQKISQHEKLIKPYTPIPKNYYKYNKYQLIDKGYKGGIIKHTYKQPLTKLSIKDIQSKIFDNYINQSNNKYLLYELIEIDLNKPITNDKIEKITDLILNNGGLDIKVFDYNITKIYCIPYKVNDSLSKDKIKDNKIIKSCLINELNKIIKSVNLVLSMYNLLTLQHKQDKSFYEIVEHLCFNSSFDYLKQEGLLAKINLAYKNQFNEKREILFTNNRYIQLYYPFKVSSVDAMKLMMTNVGLYSISKPRATTQIFNIIKDKLDFLGLKPENLVITDATAGLGGDTLPFSREFKAVNSIEIQEPHHTAVKNNAELFNLRNINHVNADYTKIYDTLEQDIIFIDSPWGGTAYKTDTGVKMNLFGSNIPFTKFIKKLRKVNKKVIIFLKVPNTFDISLLKVKMPKEKIDVNTVDNYSIITII
jgi:16S rRNA G966 N2-methylase RsmD